MYLFAMLHTTLALVHVLCLLFASTLNIITVHNKWEIISLNLRRVCNKTSFAYYYLEWSVVHELQKTFVMLLLCRDIILRRFNFDIKFLLSTFMTPLASHIFRFATSYVYPCSSIILLSTSPAKYLRTMSRIVTHLPQISVNLFICIFHVQAVPSS